MTEHLEKDQERLKALFSEVNRYGYSGYYEDEYSEEDDYWDDEDDDWEDDDYDDDDY